MLLQLLRIIGQFADPDLLKEKYSKLCIVVEESDETQFWLEMLLSSKFLPQSNYDKLYNECTEIVKVMTIYKMKLGAKL